MPNKAKPYRLTYLLTFEGKSRGWENEPTFQEEMIAGFIKSLLQVLQVYFKTMKIKLVRSDLSKN